METTAYLAGLIAADGHLDKGEKSVSIYSNNTGFCKDVRSMLEEASGKNARIYESKGAFKIYSYCPSFYELLLEKYCLFVGRKSHLLRFPENLSLDEAKSFLMGYADGDGSIYIEKRKRRGKVELYPRVELASKSEKFLAKIKSFLEANGVKCGNVNKATRIFRLRIYAGNATKFVEFIGFRHPEKVLSSPTPQGVDKLPTLEANSL